MTPKRVHLNAAAALRRNPRPLWRAALIVAVYLIAFILLDFMAKQFEELRGVVAWYPPVGLTYTLLLVFGVRFAPAVTLALLLSSLFVYRMPQPLFLLFLWALIISSIYSAAAAFLRHRLRFDWQMRKLREVTWLIVAAVFVSALLAVLSISSSALSSDMPRGEVLHAIFVWWIGETVGVLTVTPFLLVHVMPWLKRLAEGQPVRLPVRRSFPRPTLSVLGQALSIACMFYWVFGARVLDGFQPMYLITLPLIWIALDHGFKGITTGIVVLNFGVTLVMWFFRFDLAGLGELQLLMIVNCMVGLLMGAVVTERKQAEAVLQARNRDLAVINTTAIEFASAQANRDLYHYMASKLKQLTGAAAATLALYDSQTRELQVEHAELDQNLMTDLILSLGGERLTEAGFALAEDARRDLIQNPVRIQPALNEITFGVISPAVGKIVQPVQGLDRFAGVAYVVDGELYGVSVLGLRAGQPDPALEILRSFANLAAVSLKRNQAEQQLAEYSKQLEERVEARTRELHDAQQKLVRQEKLAALGQLAAGVSHELRNPLGVITNAIYFLELIQPNADPQVTEYLGIIHSETRAADKIVTDLLDFSRFTAAAREPVRVSKLAARALLRYPPPAPIHLTLALPEDLPPVLADPRQMDQVLGNLILNACQAMPEGGQLTLTAQATGDQVRLSVVDTGSGIAPEHMHRLFEPLFTTKAKGIGLGLAVSKKLVEANEGRIEVQSEPGWGSTFTILLPVAAALPHAVSQAEKEK